MPGGSFRMGSDEGRDDERPAHPVEVAAFLIGRTPVTRAEYAPFLAGGLAEPPPWWRDRAFAAGDQPVVGITWFDAERYAEWLCGQVGGTWRLPTEAEWERAARGGIEGGRTAWGDALPADEVPRVELSGPWPVGRGTANGFGLFDMGTIVHEWCLDWYHPRYYQTGAALDPRGPDEGVRRSSRGGSWRHHVRWSSPAARSSLRPDARYADYGFRVVKEID